MSRPATDLDELVKREYKEGFVTDIEADTFPPGLDESVIKALSAKKNEPEFMLEWRLAAFASPLTPTTVAFVPLILLLPGFYAQDLGFDVASVGNFGSTLIKFFQPGSCAY